MCDISVIVPTRNRADGVCRNVSALVQQTIAACRFEVIVVADGCDDHTAEALRALDTRFRLRVVEQAASGPASARNAGAALARGALLVFLDDDMLADPTLLQAHWEAQHAAPGLLVGFFTAPPWLRSDRPIRAFSNEWWDELMSRMGSPADDASFKRVCTGNLSVSRSAFLEVGGFDVGVGNRAGEDWEFGVRWERAGGSIRYCPAAKAHHLDQPSIRKALDRAHAEGRGHAWIARRHAATFMKLPLKSGIDGQPWFHLGKWRRLSPARARVCAAVAAPLARLFDAIKLRRAFAGAFGIAKTARYWSGVFEEVGGLSGFRTMLQDIPAEVSAETMALPAGAAGVAATAVASVTGPGPRPISVVVCTRDRPNSLRQCLASLGRLRYPAMEIIVVDNASTSDDTRRITVESGARYLREDRPGLDWARNRGWLEARHDIVAYIDDDAQADPYWLSGINLGFTGPAVAAVTGLILPAELHTRAQQIFEAYGNGMSKGTTARLFDPARMTAEQLIRAQDIGVGTNMAFRKSALHELGGFDTALDVGTPACGAGDLDMLHRVLVAGRSIAYQPSAIVRHRHRRDMEGLVRQYRNNGRSYGVYLIKLWRGGSVPKGAVLRFGVWIWARWLLGRPMYKLVGRHRLPMRALLAELLGALSSPFAYRATYRNDGRLHSEYLHVANESGESHA